MGIVIEAAADVVVAALGQRLVLVKGAAALELGLPQDPRMRSRARLGAI